jgi:hypothetical protein
VGGDDGDAVGALDGSVERQRREAVLGQKRSVDRRSTRIRFSSSGDDGAKERRPASTCATGTRSFAAASAPTSVELVSPKTTTASGCSFRSAASIAGSRWPVSSPCVPEPDSSW